MRHWLLFVLGVLLLTGKAAASHIVGGEFSLQATGSRSANYELGLNLYFDDLNGDPRAEDAAIFVAVYSKATHARTDTFTLPRMSTTAIPYENPTCAMGKLGFRQIRYGRTVSLNPAVYRDPEGYYVVWERCCRNAAITNIIDPGGTGNAFYLEFPALTDDGARVTNSSPAFAAPPGRFACVNAPFTLPFGATDADGDALRYSLATPYQGHSSGRETAPDPKPAPYLPVQWAPGYDAGRVAGGNPPLAVDATTGTLTFTPTEVGLFVFTVRCEEFRNGHKLGEVRRDFQVMVLDCPPNQPPALAVRRVGGSGSYREGEVWSLPGSGARCLTVLATDPDPNTTLQLDLLPLNFEAGLVTLQPTTGNLNGVRDTLQARLCFSPCFPNRGEPLVFDLVASDNGCPAGLRDTLRMVVQLEAPPNEPPQVRTTLTGNPTALLTGQALQFDVIATDPDGDRVTIRAVGRDFSPEEAGMAFENGRSGEGSLTVPFHWRPDCRNEAGRYQVDFVVEDARCDNQGDQVTVTIDLASVPVSAGEFVPPNVFTPNGDTFNDCFEVPDLPADDCQDYFLGVAIYNRWGEQVYTSDQRNFRWSGENNPSGVYFYQLRYSKRRYKGWVSLLR